MLTICGDVLGASVGPREFHPGVMSMTDDTKIDFEVGHRDYNGGEVSLGVSHWFADQINQSIASELRVYKIFNNLHGTLHRPSTIAQYLSSCARHRPQNHRPYYLIVTGCPRSFS